MEEYRRFMIFKENKERIDDHNQKAFEGKYSYYLEINSYADMLNEEFSQLMNGFRVDLKQVKWYDMIMINFAHETTTPWA